MGDKITIEVLEERVSNWMDTTTEYRKSLCSKIENITTLLTALPCKERKAWYIGMGKQVAFMWVVIAILFGVVVKDNIDRGATLQRLKNIQAEIK